MLAKTRKFSPFTRRGRLDAKVSELMAARRRGGNKRRLPKPPRPKSVKPIQIRYNRELKKIVEAMIASVEKTVSPYLEEILRQAQVGRPKVDYSEARVQKLAHARTRADVLARARMDDYADQIEEIVQLARLQFIKLYPDSFYRQVAEGIALATDDLSFQNINAVFEKVFGSSYSRFEPWVTQEVKGFVKANVDLITSIEEQYFSKIEGIVLRGAQAGWSHAELVTDIQKAGGVSEDRAAFIARDQVAKFNGNLTELRQKQAGISKYEWSTSEDERVRDSHRELNGKIFSWNDPPEVGNPGEDFNCRCVAIPVFEDVPDPADE